MWNPDQDEEEAARVARRQAQTKRRRGATPTGEDWLAAARKALAKPPAHTELGSNGRRKANIERFDATTHKVPEVKGK